MSFTDEEIAQIAHGAAVELAIVLGQPALGPWRSLDPNARGNEVFLVKIARYGATPEVVHEHRMQLDPDLPPFDQLLPEDRAKDYLFAGVCAAMNRASDVKTRAENEQAALAEAARVVAATAGGNEPFGGAQPSAVELAPQPPAPTKED